MLWAAGLLVCLLILRGGVSYRCRSSEQLSELRSRCHGVGGFSPKSEVVGSSVGKAPS